MVTGAGRGIGEATARAFADQGYAVIALDLRFDARPDADGVHQTVLDLADHAACREFAESVDSLDVLVNAAAVRPEASLLTQGHDGFVRALDVNLLAPFVLMQALVPKMAAGSVVINLSSGAAYGKRHLSAYGASKAALISLGATAALELAEIGIRVNTIIPGTTDTPMLAEARQHSTTPRAGGARNLNGRALTADEVAAAIVRTANEPEVTGAVIPVGLLPASW